jgi:hypothetical protein
MAARSSIRTDAMIDQIIERLSRGEPLAQICRSDGMPDASTFWRWQQDDPDLAQSIARAREQGFDQIAMDSLAIVDDLSEEPASRKIRAEHRLKLLAKWDPKRYGERTTIQGDPDNPVAVKSTHALSDEALAAIAAGRA